jgi:DNA-binding PadR family transcriptional regulator
MSAKHAVLGLVIEKPGYGYELAQRLEDRCGAWAWARPGVYSALDQLAAEGHVHSVGRKGSGATGRAAPRTVYESTQTGRDFHAHWLFGSSALKPVRQDLDLKMLFAGPEFFPRLIDQTYAQEQQCLDELGSLTRARPAVQPNQVPSLTGAAALLLRDFEIKQLEVRIEHLQKARSLMKEMMLLSGGSRAV